MLYGERERVFTGFEGFDIEKFNDEENANITVGIAIKDIEAKNNEKANRIHECIYVLLSSALPVTIFSNEPKCGKS